MSQSHNPLNQSFCKVLLLILILCAAGSRSAVAAQQPAAKVSPERDRGIALYDKGDAKGAAAALRAAVKQDKDDGEAWHFLGLALVRADDMKGARKAFETAVKLRPDFGPAHTGLAYALITADKNDEAGRHATRAIELNDKDAEAHWVLGIVHLRSGRNAEALQNADAAIAAKPNFAIAYFLKSQALLAVQGDEAARDSKLVSVKGKGPLTDYEKAQRRERAKKSRAMLAAAADSLGSYLRLAASDQETATWKEQLETLRLFAGLRDQTSPPDIVGGADVTTKARVLSKPEPTYTERARAAGIGGTIILRAVFSSNGKVEHILVLRSLPGGLTERAIVAARRITFVPATKDGKPVSVFMELQYNFALY